MTRPLRVGIAGLGTVGASVIQILARRNEILTERHGRPVQVTAISARDRAKDRGFDLSRYRWFDDPLELATSDEVDCVVELVGGSEGTAREIVETALTAGKHVVTANKALLAKHGLALARLAETEGRRPRVRGVGRRAASRSSRPCARRFPAMPFRGSTEFSTAPATTSCRGWSWRA